MGMKYWKKKGRKRIKGKRTELKKTVIGKMEVL
jgi:hypothetical protein